MDRLLSMRVFERVINEGGFAAAARALDMSPAVITRLVADLEAHLGARLVQRSTRRLALTDAGEAYLKRLHTILQDIDEADAIATDNTKTLSGELHIAAPPVLATHLLAPMLAGFREKYPNIVLDLTVQPFREPPVEDFDLTLFAAEEGFDGAMVARKILETHTILVASPAYLQRCGHPKTPEDLAHHNFLRLKVGNQRMRLLQLRMPDTPKQSTPIEFNSVLWSNDIDTLLRAALDGAGICVATMELVAELLADGALVRVLPAWIQGELSLYAAFPSRKYQPQRARVLLDHISLCCDNLRREIHETVHHAV